nr:IS1595 family transposase [Skermanella aerolata]
MCSSQPTAWRLGHAVRVLTASIHRLSGTVEIDVMMFGGAPRRDPSNPDARKGKQGHTTKTPVVVIIERPNSRDPVENEPEPKAMAMLIPNQTAAALSAALDGMTERDAHVMSDSAASIAVAASGHIAHDTVNHGATEFVRGIVHANSAEGYNDRVRRTVVGVFHHINCAHTARYLDEISWRWRQRIHVGRSPRQTRKGRIVLRNIWERVPPVEHMGKLLRGALGREMRRTKNGSVDILVIQPVFGI